MIKVAVAVTIAIITTTVIALWWTTADIIKQWRTR
jgi:hypothetical protein